MPFAYATVLLIGVTQQRPPPPPILCARHFLFLIKSKQIIGTSSPPSLPPPAPPTHPSARRCALPSPVPCREKSLNFSPNQTSSEGNSTKGNKAEPRERNGPAGVAAGGSLRLVQAARAHGVAAVGVGAYRVRASFSSIPTFVPRTYRARFRRVVLHEYNRRCMSRFF